MDLSSAEPVMKMQIKLTLFFLLTGLLSALTVGGIAFSMVMAEFRQANMERAFAHFQQDIHSYIETYGSWQAGIQNEGFSDYVRRNRPPLGLRRGLVESPIPFEVRIKRGHNPPFHFLLLDPEGIVIKPVEGYELGAQAPHGIVEKARPIEIKGKVFALAAAIGQPQLTESDLSYLKAMSRSLIVGVVFALLLALILGVTLGRRFSRTLVDLTQAIRAMSSDRETKRQVEIRSKDEFGELARAFNSMNSELVQAHKQLLDLSWRDPLTGLHNRRYFDEHALPLFKQAQRYNQPFSVMIGDLDYFKQINDRFSHDAGDEVLKRTAKLLSEGIRETDIVARFGGEEFVILFANTGALQASLCCEQLLQAIEHSPWHEIHSELNVTISMGLCDRLALGSVAEMLAAADKALYQAKHNGRNRLVVHY